MKYILLSCTLVAMLIACSPNTTPEATQQDTTITTAPAENESYEAVAAAPLDSGAVIYYEINNDGIMDSIVFFDPIVGDPGAFSQVAFYISGMEKQVFTAKNGWDYANGALQNTNTVNSDLLYISRQGDEVFFGIIGYTFPGGKENAVFRYKDKKLTLLHHTTNESELHFGYYGKEGKLKAIIQSADWEGPTEIGDYPDGFVEYYAPQHIYDLDDSMHLNVALTQQYNEEFYAWGGLQPADSLLVYRNRDSLNTRRIIKLR